MKNLSRQAIRRLFDFSDSAPHGINPLQALLFLSVVLPFARAQSGTDSPPDYSYQFNTSINPSMAIIIAILVCAFFFVGFFAVYLRHCMDSSSGSGADGLLLGGGGRRPQRVSAIGLDPEVIESFPIVIYSAVKDLKIGKAALECAVCLNELEDDDLLRLLPKCDHVFHPECIDAWLASHTTCPVCRTNLIPDPNEIPKNSQQTHNSNESSGLGEVQNQVSIDIRQDQAESDSQTVEISSTTSQILKQNRPPRSRSTTIGRIYGKFPRSHSTGHSLIQPGGEGFERYTLRLPEEIRKQIVMNSKLKRTKSYGVVLPREGSSRRGYRSGGEGSSKGRSYLDRGFGRFDRRSKSDRWVFTLAPPFLSRLGSIKSAKLGGSGEATAQDANSKTSVALVPKPSDSLAVEVDGAGQSSARP